MFLIVLTKNCKKVRIILNTMTKMIIAGGCQRDHILQRCSYFNTNGYLITKIYKFYDF